MKLLKSIILVFLLMLFISCENENVPVEESTNDLKYELTKVDIDLNSINNERNSGGIEGLIASINESLLDHNLQIEKMEFLGMEGAGNTVFFNNKGNKQLGSDFVPNDPRNVGGTDVPYWTDGTQLGTSSGMSNIVTYNAIVNTMNTWDAVSCSGGLGIPEIGVAPFDAGFVQFLFGFGGTNGFIPGTILHAGILPGAFFDVIGGPGGSTVILGVTFTFIWSGPDLDGNGKSDVAIKEIYINDNFNWQDAPDDGLFNGIVDFETVVLHEVGHGLSQGHFGKAFANNGGLHFSPAALMNAGYSVGRRDISGTDNGGHCSNWGEWPNN